MKRIAAALLLAVTATGAHAAEPDKAVGRALDTLKYTYEVDEDGDYKMVFDMDDGRSQLAFVRSTVEEFGKHKIREIWSPAYNSPGKQFPAAVANRLLEDSQDAKRLGEAGPPGDVRGQGGRQRHPGSAQRRHRCGHPHGGRHGARADRAGRILR